MKPMRYFILLLSFAGLLVGGCQPLGSGGLGGLAPVSSEETGDLKLAEQELQESGEIFNTTVVEGMITGAIMGGVTGLLAGGDMEGALIGATAGAAVGGVGGYYISQQQKKYANEEDRITAIVNDVREDSRSLDAYQTATSNYVAKSKARLSRMTKQYREKSVSEMDLQQQLARIQANRTQIAGSIETLAHKRDSYQTALEKQKAVSGEQSVAQLSEEITRLNGQVGRLEQQLGELDNALELSAV